MRHLSPKNKRKVVVRFELSSKDKSTRQLARKIIRGIRGSFSWERKLQPQELSIAIQLIPEDGEWGEWAEYKLVQRSKDEKSKRK